MEIGQKEEIDHGGKMGIGQKEEIDHGGKMGKNEQIDPGSK
jgi:hypothetical protein